RQCGFQVLAFSQLERVEAAAGQVEQLLALDVADGAQLARELETPAENLRLAVATSLANGAELNRNQRDSQKVVLQLRYRIGRTQADSQPAIPQPPLLAFRLPARKRQDERTRPPLRIFIRIAPFVDHDFTLLDEPAHTRAP